MRTPSKVLKRTAEFRLPSSFATIGVRTDNSTSDRLVSSPRRYVRCVRWLQPVCTSAPMYRLGAPIVLVRYRRRLWLQASLWSFSALYYEFCSRTAVLDRTVDWEAFASTNHLYRNNTAKLVGGQRPFSIFLSARRFHICRASSLVNVALRNSFNYFHFPYHTRKHRNNRQLISMPIIEDNGEESYFALVVFVTPDANDPATLAVRNYALAHRNHYEGMLCVPAVDGELTF